MGGDHFDWSVDGDRLTVTVLNGAGIGLSAALLTAVTVNAMRNARRSGGGLVEQAELASDTVFYQHRGAGTWPRCCWRWTPSPGGCGRWTPVRRACCGFAGTVVAPIALEQQLPLGMFAETRYDVQEFDLSRGTGCFVVSDGVWAADPVAGRPYGERAMARSMRSTRLQPATEAVGTVMRELHAYHADADLRDDAVVVCLDWRGSGRAGRRVSGRQRRHDERTIAGDTGWSDLRILPRRSTPPPRRSSVCSTRPRSRHQVAVPPTQLRVLSLISSRPETNVNRLAELLDVVPSSASRLCDRLEATGLLRRVPDPRDRREVRLVPTAAAVTLLARGAGAPAPGGAGGAGPDAAPGRSTSCCWRCWPSGRRPASGAPSRRPIAADAPPDRPRLLH